LILTGSEPDISQIRDKKYSGTRSKEIAYGNNRADFGFVGGVVPGLLLFQPDFLENKEDWSVQ